MLLRTLLADRVERAWATGEVAGDNESHIREILGHDTDTLHRYLYSEKVITTTPHASANIFFPRADTHVHAARMAREGGGFQIRAVLTHTTLSDLRWRPYAWWVASKGSDLTKIAFESRNKSRKHVAVHACAPTEIRRDIDRVPSTYRDAWSWACSARNLAWSLMILAARQERLSGVTDAGRTLFVPLQWVAEVAASWLCAGRAASDVRERLRQRGRRLDETTGRLVDAGPGEEPFVFDNATNLTMLGMFTHLLVGSEKMAGYWPMLSADGVPGVADLISPPTFHMKPPSSLADVYPPSPRLAEQLAEAGIPYSLGIAQSSVGTPLI